ncbi:aminoglycoside phosphotransferase family protein [Diplocloster hominis]|uniref:phosphotransferase family protein n=1 Tax=Diplocloster hominis TaxID=3079010 RepID=UPI0031B9D4D3
MKLDQIIATRDKKTVYKTDGLVIKVFNEDHPKSDVFNEALNHARVEETGLNIPKVVEVSQTEGKWAIATEYVEGKTLAQMMEEDPDHLQQYMNRFVDLQLEVHSKSAPLLNKLKDKLNRQISSLSGELSATARYELHTRLDSMPKHAKVCHGDFNPTNIIIDEAGTAYIIDWAHATQGNASADAANTYLQFSLYDQRLAEMYMSLFCEKSDTAKQYVQQWLPIVAAAQLTKGNEKEKDFLLKWIDVFDYQ